MLSVVLVSLVNITFVLVVVVLIGVDLDISVVALVGMLAMAI